MARKGEAGRQRRAKDEAQSKRREEEKNQVALVH